MKTLEEYLIENEILEQFLGNFDNRYKASSEININTAFTWAETKEGRWFWQNHHSNSSNLSLLCVDRIKELIKERIPRFRKEIV